MKDETKEILDNIKSKYEDYYVQDIVSGNDLKLLSDYITNLQTIEQQYSAILSENAELQQAKDKLQNDYQEAVDKITNLQEEKDNYKHKFWEEQELNEYLQDRIDKPIKELETLLPLCIMPNNTLIHGTEKAKTIEEVLEILKGE